MRCSNTYTQKIIFHSNLINTTHWKNKFHFTAALFIAVFLVHTHTDSLCHVWNIIFHGPYGKRVKCTLVQALRLCTGHTAHRGSRGIALLFHNHGSRRGWRVSVMLQLLFTPRKDPVPIVQEAGWAPGPVWTGAENLAPNGIRPPDRPAHSQSLYQLRYPANVNHMRHQGFLREILEKKKKLLYPHLKQLWTTRCRRTLYSGVPHGPFNMVSFLF